MLFSNGSLLAAIIDSLIPGIEHKYKVSWIAFQSSSEIKTALFLLLSVAGNDNQFMIIFCLVNEIIKVSPRCRSGYYCHLHTSIRTHSVRIIVRYVKLFRLVPYIPAFWQINLTGRRISCKKRESRKFFELRRQLNPHVGRRCAPDNMRRFRRPVERTRSVRSTFA